MDTIYISIASFIFAALLGMYLISYVLQEKKTPRFAVFLHGPLALVGLLLLILYSADQGPGFTAPIVIFSIAVVGGVLLIALDFSGKTIPKWIALGHGLLAVTGFIALLVCVF